MTEDTKQEARAKSAVETVTFTLDGQEVTVPKGTTILEAARQHNINIPTFCWHPKLKPVGSCRMCYVEIEKSPKLQVSCCTEPMNGMVVHTASDKVLQGRKAVLEFTLLNHPLDCPTCDKGGECDLQNLTFAHGYDDSRFDFQKTRYTDDTEGTTFDDKRLGPEIILNRNRCIVCYKCVRSNKEAFGEYDLGAYERGNITEINSAPGKQVDNPYSGNLVEICPVGALTNSDWRYKIRVWLTQQAKSICPFTSSGTNTLLYYERHQNKIFRTTSRPNDEIDDGWLADVTRYGYQVATSPDRLTRPLIKKEGVQVESSWQEALELIGKKLTSIQETKGNVCVGGLIYPGLDNASLYSFNKLMRSTIGSHNVDYRTDYRMLPSAANTPFDILMSSPFRIADIDDSDVILTIGTDLLREHPNEYLRIRKAFNFNHARLFVANSYAVKHADIAESELTYAIGTDEAFVSGICLAAIEQGMVSVADADGLKTKLKPATLAECADICGVTVEEISALARALADGRKVTVIGGELIARSRERNAISAALCNMQSVFNIEAKGQIAILARYANSRGAEMLGLDAHPSEGTKELLKSLWKEYPECEERNTDEMLVRARKEDVTAVIIMGADPVSLYPDQEFVREGLERLEFMVACDLFETATTQLADVVLPLASWAEYEGEYVNLEGRVQATEAALKSPGEAKPGYAIAALIAEKLQGKPLFESKNTLCEDIEKLINRDSAIQWPSEWLAVEHVPEPLPEGYSIPLVIGDDPHHCSHLTEKSESLSNFQSDAYVEVSPELAMKLKLNDGETVRVSSEVGKVMVPVRISNWLDGDVVFIPRNFSSTAVTSLLMRKRRIDWVKISKVEG